MEAKLILESQKTYFLSRATRDVEMLKNLLTKLRSEILEKEDAIYDALYKDFKKSTFEAYFSEVGIVISEIDYTLKHIDSWSKPKKIRAALLNFPSKDYIYSEPYGTVLVIAPWNYPFQLVFCPLIGVISSGCCAILKPSPDAPNTSMLMEKMIAEIFEEDYISVVQGDKKETQLLLKNRFDHIFFTGSTRVGKIVMKAAAEFLTPVVLELGGKSPCIVDQTANLEISAKRIAWSKAINAGQTCIAPDYVLVHQSLKDELISKIEKSFAAT